jgi:beta-lactamase class D
VKTFLSILALTLLLASCTQNNVTEDESLKQYFDSAGVAGTFGMFDNGQGHFTIYNLKRFRDSAYLPAATFDILQSLIGIQTGVMKDDSTVVAGLTLRQAFQAGGDSNRIIFKELAARIGRDTLKKWIDSMSYGNKDISSAVDTFWLDNHLTITSDEQLGMVKKLYFEQLPFHARPQKLVREMMLREGNSNYQLSYKTAVGVRKDGHAFAWIVGWVEENKHPYFFVLNVDTTDKGKDLTSRGLNILKDILKQMGFFQGKK